MHLLLSDIRILSRIHIQRLISNFSLIFLTNPCRLIRITIDLSPKRDFVRDNSLTRYSCSTISRPRLSLGDIAKTHSRMNLVSLTASHAFLIGIRMYSRPRNRRVHCHAFRVYSEQSRISVTIPTCAVKAQRPNKSDKRRRCTRSFVSRDKMERRSAWGISNRGFRSSRDRGRVVGYIVRLCRNNDVIMEDFRVKFFPILNPERGC